MLDLNITIEVKDEHDLDTVIRIIKSIGIEKPVYILDYGYSYRVCYNANEYVERIDDILASEFSNYEMVEDIGVGQTTIKIIVSIIQTPASTDNWGRPFNSDTITKTYYFIDGKIDPPVVIPKDNLRVLFGAEERHYPVYITPVIHKLDNNRKGFVVTKTPFKEAGAQDLLSDKIFSKPEEAVWEGYRNMEEIVEEEYQKSLIEFKRKRKKRGKN